jgi:hypothetical protein
MIRIVTSVHRWLGVAFCLLFAMWFASGIVMHFVPFPKLTDGDRIDGLAPVFASGVQYGPADAVTASKIPVPARVRLQQRSGGTVYVVSDEARVTALHATDLSDASVHEPSLALMIVMEHGRQRGLDITRAAFAELAAYDQWTVSNASDRHRPLHRIALNDAPGHEFYVSSATGEVVQQTTTRERRWNYAGSVAHWIYPTALRMRPALWRPMLWALSFAALITVILGLVVGVARITVARGRLPSPYRGWHAWHYIGGLACTPFVLAWTFSGWLSMDDGLLFSSGKLTEAEWRSSRAPQWEILAHGETQRISPLSKEVEWFSFGGKLYRRERTGPNTQALSLVGAEIRPPGHALEFLDVAEVRAFADRLASGCRPPVLVGPKDSYAVAATIRDAPVYRSVCGNVWYHVDGASGAVLDRLDVSRRAYRWLYGALHRLDVPILAARPTLRTTLIFVLGLCGFAFSLTAIVIGWRRLTISLSD